MTHVEEDDIIQDEKMPALETMPEIRIISHSPILYWWPVWLSGFVFALLTALFGETVTFSDGREVQVLGSTAPGLIFLGILLFVVLATNVKMRGMLSIMAIGAVAFLIILFGWLGILDNIARAIPQLSIHLNFAFYMVFSTVLLIIWASMFFIFDRFTTWRIRPGQMTEQHLIGSRERSFDARGMLFEQRSDDIFRHNILGLGAGDLVLLTSGGRKEEIKVFNVLRVEKKVDAIQKLVAVQPDDLMEHSEQG